MGGPLLKEFSEYESVGGPLPWEKRTHKGGGGDGPDMIILSQLPGREGEDILESEVLQDGKRCTCICLVNVQKRLYLDKGSEPVEGLE